MALTCAFMPVSSSATAGYRPDLQATAGPRCGPDTCFREMIEMLVGDEDRVGPFDGLILGQAAGVDHQAAPGAVQAYAGMAEFRQLHRRSAWARDVKVSSVI